MWKDFFYFSKAQRIGIIILVILIFLASIANYFLPFYFPKTENIKSDFLSEVTNFKKSLVSRDSLRLAQWQIQNEERQRQFQEKYAQFPDSKPYDKVPKYSLFKFDPNKLDSIGFLQLGLKSFIASNIIRFRNKGGLFRNNDDFAKVYGLMPEKFKELEPYISIQDVPIVKPESKQSELKKDVMVDLNSADTSLLMQVKGIGRGYAKGIVRFRNETGGFVSVDQLAEIYGMRPEIYERIRAFCFVNLDLVKKIRVNYATVDKLNMHPYISFYQAKAMYELRRKKGKLKQISELNVIDEFTPELILKIAPYLSFD
ncbi:MAG: hypothetical protein GZ091_01640 [Paludibacter sp.]|nr:hypothetical protein [Paludibacter sp.]